MKKTASVVLAVVIIVLSFAQSANAISAKACVVINGDTGRVIYSVNANARLPMASTTKIMTALLLCEYGNLDRQITVTKEMVTVEGSSMGLLPGDKVTLRDLLYGMMLPSGNDAANTVAFVVGGNIKNFVKMMNDKAHELGLKDTHFDTPSGLDGDSHYTTAYELALITQYAFEFEEFAKAVSSKTATLNYGNPPYKRTLTNHNRLLKLYDDVVGVKTGFTKKSGRCLVSAARRDGKFVIAVTLNDGNDWKDHRTLLDIGLEAVTVKDISYDKKVDIRVVGGYDDKISVGFKSVKMGLLKDEKADIELNVPNMLYAPIKKGDIIGSITYSVNGAPVREEKIVSPKEIKYKNKSFILRLWDSFKFILYNV